MRINFANINELFAFIDDNSIEAIISFADKNTISEQKQYQMYYEILISDLKKRNKYLSIIWNLYIKRIKLLAKVNLSVKNVKAELDYFDKRPFYYTFKRHTNPTVYLNDSNKSPSQLEAIIDIKENIESYKSLEKILSDDASTKCLFNIMMYRMTMNINYLNEVYDRLNRPYFDNNIIDMSLNEVFVDCGGYDGKTSAEIINNSNLISKIYFYEPDEENMEKAKLLLSKSKVQTDIIYKMFGVSKKNGRAFFNFNSNGTSNLSEAGSTSIPIVSLDEDIIEKVTFVKMDIEGEEYKALEGCEKHIMYDQPKLVICLYHRISDIWRIPKLIKSLNNNYLFYIRHYSYGSTETVLYAIPKKGE